VTRWVRLCKRGMTSVDLAARNKRRCRTSPVTRPTSPIPVRLRGSGASRVVSQDVRKHLFSTAVRISQFSLVFGAEIGEVRQQAGQSPSRPRCRSGNSLGVVSPQLSRNKFRSVCSAAPAARYPCVSQRFATKQTTAQRSHFSGTTTIPGNKHLL
jgi:hypothetical protein